MGANKRCQNGGEYAQYQTGVHKGGRHCQNAGAQRSLQQMCQRFAVTVCHQVQILIILFNHFLKLFSIEN